tara:strand:+ start:104 stop:421 length:318 start_codon:yes stop_codon:yes gene_type:complete
MKKFKKLCFILILTLMFQGCSTLKEGFRSQKKNSTDEFLVEKKSPLVMPPEYNELPLPEIENSENENLEDNDIKKLLTNTDNVNSNSNKQNKDFKNSILDKIKNN